MAAKGSQLKAEIIQKILTTFPNSFSYNDGKEVRINGLEDGNLVQIKLTFTCAKVPVENEGKTITINEKTSSENNNDLNFETINEPSEDEKARLKILLEKMNLA